ncbi:aminotransferase class IV [bacterium]|nr:aminotransferase class IV [bacterium]
MTMVHWNGRLMDAEDAVVSVFDAGFLYGDGIYETLRVYEGRAFAAGPHLERLAQSGARIDLTVPDEDDLRDAIDALLSASRLASAVLRITVTRGRLARRLDLSSAGTPSVLLTAEPFDASTDAERRRGVRVIYSRYLRYASHPLLGVKSTNYQVSLFARNEAREAGAAEVLVPNESGDIVEGAAANVFLVENGTVVTPPLDSGILGGITRDVVIRLARDAGHEVREETLPRGRLAAADEVFLTGTTIEVAPVIRLGETPVGSGRPGPVSRAMLRGYLDAVAEDIGVPLPEAPPA